MKIRLLTVGTMKINIEKHWLLFIKNESGTF